MLASSELLCALCPSFVRAGSGRRVGENCEHTWAAVRPITKLTRYMGKRRYLASLDTAFQLLSEDKLEGFVAAAAASHAACIQKLGAITHWFGCMPAAPVGQLAVQAGPPAGYQACLSTRH